ncbi:MAG: exodeoxyribonuclease V subunit gamma, partial [Nitriliruptoraceae bacterium]
MLTVHHHPDADHLATELARVLAAPLSDPLAVEPVAVHSRGLERWLAQRLSHTLGAGPGGDDGVCAAIDFPFPGALIGRALAAVGGVDAAHDPWRADRLAWELLELLTTEPELAEGTPLAPHLLGPGDGERRFAAVRHLADLFDRYGVHRPTMLRRWIDGDGAVDADGHPLPATHAWQARLWLRLHDRLAPLTPSPPERLGDAGALLGAEPHRVALPDRVSLFGLTALPASYLDVLAALAVHREVHLFLLHPSPQLWSRVGAALRAAPADRPPPRDADPTAELVHHPLLRSWARDAREMQVVLAAAAGASTATTGAEDETEVAAAPDHAGTSLLHRLQAAVRGDLPLPPPGIEPDPRPVLAADDTSLEVHGCHGRARQVEVLRDVLLHRFGRDPSLAPRDVLVLCPDLEAFAPHLEATFAPATASDVHAGADDGTLRAEDLRVRLADRSLRRSNPLLEVLTDLLALARGRMSASAVLDLAGRAPVRARFGFDDAELERLAGWVGDLGIRWGLDAAHREQHGVPTDANTWRFGLDRLLTGIAVADEDAHTSAGVVPHDDVEGEDVALAGRFAELVERLGRLVDELSRPYPLDAWRQRLLAAVDGLATTDEDERWQRLQLARLLDDTVADATDAEGRCSAVELTPAEVADLLGRRLDRGSGPASHRTGELTVCSMVPMRSVPHRLVVLLGMDDGALPRAAGHDGDDLTQLRPRVGDRDPRTEDRQLLLDALLAARDAFVVLYAGRDERTNEPRPPAVPVGELLDVVDRTVRTDGAGPAAAHEAISIEHPLHASDPRNFRADGPGRGGPFGTDPAALAAAEARRGADRPAGRPLLDAPLPPLDSEVIELTDLVRAVAQPARALLVDRLGVALPREAEPPIDDLSTELAGLARWRVGDALLGGMLAGHDLERLVALEHGRGGLPPGALATPAVDDLLVTLAALTDLASELGACAGGTADAAVDDDAVAGAQPDGEVVEVDVRLEDGRRLVGAVEG